MKAKFLCKSDGIDGNRFTFVRDKWYDGGSRIGLTGKKYWVINEQGEKQNLTKSEMSGIFYMDLGEVKDKKIDEIFGGEING